MTSTFFKSVWNYVKSNYFILTECSERYDVVKCYILPLTLNMTCYKTVLNEENQQVTQTSTDLV